MLFAVVVGLVDGCRDLGVAVVIVVAMLPTTTSVTPAACQWESSYRYTLFLFRLQYQSRRCDILLWMESGN